MARIIHTNSPGKRRHGYMRTGAEILRRLSQQKEIDQDTQDMTAMLVYSLRAIDGTVEESVQAWERRGYWKKVDDFQQKWWWASLLGLSIEKLVKAGDWDELPAAMAKLFPHFADIQVSKLTRDPKMWAGSYQKLMSESGE